MNRASRVRTNRINRIVPGEWSLKPRPFRMLKMLNGALPVLEPEPLTDSVSVSSVRARPKLALVVPTLCEAANVRTVVDRVRSSLDPLEIPYELIVVDDDSQDGTARIVRK